MAAIINQKEAVLLHGTLDVWVLEAKCLPDVDELAGRCRQCLDVCRSCLPKSTGYRSSDVYVSVTLAGAKLARTQVKNNEEYPVWHEHFYIPVAHRAEELIFKVGDDVSTGAGAIGRVSITAKDLSLGRKMEGWFDILGPGRRHVNDDAQLKLSVHLLAIPSAKGLGGGPEYHGIHRVYFPLRKGCRLRLFQDAHVEPGLPDIPLERGEDFEHGKCWEDISNAFLKAKDLIYIAGWSTWHELKLTRPSPSIPAQEEMSLGELLIQKSQEGVRVQLLVWHDTTSNDSRNVTGVVTASHGEETMNFFKSTNVSCRLSTRSADTNIGWFRRKVVAGMYTHHQNFVLVDAVVPNSDTHQLVAFLGGLDFCGGRFDTPQHSLFRTMDNVHRGDYHQAMFSSVEGNGGPREPWLDLHCKLEGPAAYDVLTNFEQRWGLTAKASPVIGDTKLYIVPESDPETWHAQIFRSIDSGSCGCFPGDLQEAERQHLVCRGTSRIDHSVHLAYVEAIRRAQNFIYIENQYFMGSSYNWPDYRKARADHLIPMELALKIAGKIKAGERFMVYVVIPMFPEGHTSSTVVQETLFFQSQTMKMMYTIIAKALQTKKMRGKFKPQDYLLVFCLGTRETVSASEPRPSIPPTNSTQIAVQKSRRFIISVHSKGMIVDDEFVILGSANINQRSMAGDRDTEIAIGAYQPSYTWGKKGYHPKGEVYGYRQSLWAEHTGTMEPCFSKPDTLECAQRMKSIGDDNWAVYASDNVTDMKGHLLTYPIQVEDDGTVNPLPGHDTFPDVGGDIIGHPTDLPDAGTA